MRHKCDIFRPGFRWISGHGNVLAALLWAQRQDKGAEGDCRCTIGPDMGVLVEINEQLQRIETLIVELERETALRRPAPPSLVANIRSLEKERTKLEAEFDEI